MQKESIAGAISQAEPQPFEVKQAFWGYVVRGAGGPPVLLQVAQGVVLAFGAAFTAASLLLVMSASGAESEGLSTMRSGLSVLLATFALLLVWFATRGSVVELQLDLPRGELREMVRHRVGRSTVLARHALDGMASLNLVQGEGRDAPSSLILKLHNRDRGVCIARGPEPALIELRRRLSRDLRLRNLTLAREISTGRLPA